MLWKIKPQGENKGTELRLKRKYENKESMLYVRVCVVSFPKLNSKDNTVINVIPVTCTKNE